MFFDDRETLENVVDVVLLRVSQPDSVTKRSSNESDNHMQGNSYIQLDEETLLNPLQNARLVLSYQTSKWLLVSKNCKWIGMRTPHL